ncbi:ejaculatory bulb-specific protein 3-like isoform X1 [Helicoverpa zea]|uniref:ejaculatory bulb-specific protein 3-like isoform X1 n=2 Tax=Helicoverpa zea TaxID=7113 RepID=UPI001F5738E7|nr:ejaculatory bulb-specific protein 3-like isoform X1 [Helicoverpa zea]
MKQGEGLFINLLSINMNSAIVLCLVALAGMVLARPDDTYTTKYDNVDLDEILANDRLLIPYIKCLLDEGKCAPDAKELKEHIREALENGCAKCTDKQKEGTRRVIAHLIKHKLEEWEKLKAKYDPEGKYTHKYEKELEEVQH